MDIQLFLYFGNAIFFISSSYHKHQHFQDIHCFILVMQPNMICVYIYLYCNFFQIKRLSVRINCKGGDVSVVWGLVQQCQV